MSLSQNDTGHAFEYGLVLALSERLSIPLEVNKQLEVTRFCFERCGTQEQVKIVKAAKEIITFLIVHDTRFLNIGGKIFLQTDQKGQFGDVRDIIVQDTISHEDIGISAKNRHWSVKHSRLSAHIDFGYNWFKVPCSSEYFCTIVPIFKELYNRYQRAERWRDLSNKKQQYYIPVLHAFHTEMSRLFKNKPDQVARGLVQYLLGKYDFYKIIKENGDVSIISFNLEGTLKWGNKIRLPTRIIEIVLKPCSETTLFMTFDFGWQISFRIHNASTRVEPSLKFDINIVGLPQMVSRHVISYG